MYIPNVVNNLPTTTAAAEQFTNLYDVPRLNFHALSNGGCLVYGMLDNGKLVLREKVRVADGSMSILPPTSQKMVNSTIYST